MTTGRAVKQLVEAADHIAADVDVMRAQRDEAWRGRDEAWSERDEVYRELDVAQESLREVRRNRDEALTAKAQREVPEELLARVRRATALDCAPDVGSRSRERRKVITALLPYLQPASEEAEAKCPYAPGECSEVLQMALCVLCVNLLDGSDGETQVSEERIDEEVERAKTEARRVCRLIVDLRYDGDFVARLRAQIQKDSFGDE